MNLLIIVGIILVILGLVGSLMPALPGPIFSFLGLLFLFFEKGKGEISVFSLSLFGVGVALLMLMNYLVPLGGAKFLGASKKGLGGAIIGAFLGVIFFPPLGIFIGAFLGAVGGEMISGKEIQEAIKAGVGVLLGGVAMLFLQVMYALTVIIYFFIKLL